ncbi:RICIN domain-containing protein [Candidatus Saccharibacteria bacterium]|nr:RICIN domain-containing protein [Candidatus Saccharibacteria bacterium]
MRVVRRRDRRGWYVAVAIFAAVFLFVFLRGANSGKEAEVGAASLAEFDPGYIISDYQMGRYDSMTEAEIQKFLTSKNSCGNRSYSDYKWLSENSVATWHFKDGHFVCLSEELFGDGEVIGSGETAAHIIWQAAQDYKINPQVIMVLLQKETSLITDPIPNNYDYRKAAGYGCPDTAACSSKYYGFKNQVRNAAALFRTVLDGGWTNYPLGNNYVQYNPSAACGGSMVNIRSLATSALYRYTPYQPNASAIAAGYGYGDECGAYGNRNFYLYFQDWFGGIGEEREVVKIARVEVDIPEGDYEIASMLVHSRGLDIVGGVKAGRGANVQLNDRISSGSEAQRWHISRNEDGTYNIINPINNLALDVVGGEVTSGTNVHVYTVNGSCAQRWKITRASDGGYVIGSACSDMVLDIAGGVANVGANVQMYVDNGTLAQEWHINPIKTVEEGVYEVKLVAQKQLAIDIMGGVESAMDGTNVWMYSKNGTNAQKWQFYYSDYDGYYVIANPFNGKVLDVDIDSSNKVSNVRLMTYEGSCKQRWRIVPADGGYELYSSCPGTKLGVLKDATYSGGNVAVYDDELSSNTVWGISGSSSVANGEYEIALVSNNNMVVDITGGADYAHDGTNIQIYESNGTDAQRWYISKNSDDTYNIVNLKTGKSLDVAGGLVKSGTNVHLYTTNGTCAQRWKIESDDGNGYVIMSVCSGLALGMSGDAIVNGANVFIEDVNESRTTQHFILRKR